MTEELENTEVTSEITDDEVIHVSTGDQVDKDYMVDFVNLFPELQFSGDLTSFENFINDLQYEEYCNFGFR